MNNFSDKWDKYRKELKDLWKKLKGDRKKFLHTIIEKYEDSDDFMGIITLLSEFDENKKSNRSSFEPIIEPNFKPGIEGEILDDNSRKVLNDFRSRLRKCFSNIIKPKYKFYEAELAYDNNNPYYGVLIDAKSEKDAKIIADKFINLINSSKVVEIPGFPEVDPTDIYLAYDKVTPYNDEVEYIDPIIIDRKSYTILNSDLL